jgi:hypothetical protein
VRARLVLASLLILATSWGCAELNQLGALIQPPHFEQVPGRPAEVRLNGLDGAAVRIWTRVTNPNAFGVRLGTLKGTLFLEDSHAADAEFPLGLDLGARGESDLPIDISVSFRDLPGLGGAARRILARQPVGYRLDGTVGVDAGRTGREMLFGPMTLVSGQTTVQ